MMHGREKVGPRHSSNEAGEQKRKKLLPPGRRLRGRTQRSSVERKGGGQGECGTSTTRTWDPYRAGLRADKNALERIRPPSCHMPEVGAVCGKAARTDLGGGRAMNAVLPLWRREFITLLAARRPRGRWRRAEQGQRAADALASRKIERRATRTR